MCIRDRLYSHDSFHMINITPSHTKIVNGVIHNLATVCCSQYFGSPGKTKRGCGTTLIRPDSLVYFAGKV